MKVMEKTKKVWTLTENYQFLAKVSNDIKNKNNEIRWIDGRMNALMQRRNTLRRRLSKCEACRRRVLNHIREMRAAKIEAAPVKQILSVVGEVY